MYVCMHACLHIYIHTYIHRRIFFVYSHCVIEYPCSLIDTPRYFLLPPLSMFSPNVLAACKLGLDSLSQHPSSPQATLTPEELEEERKRIRLLFDRIDTGEHRVLEKQRVCIKEFNVAFSPEFNPLSFAIAALSRFFSFFANFSSILRLLPQLILIRILPLSFVVI